MKVQDYTSILEAAGVAPAATDRVVDAIIVDSMGPDEVIFRAMIMIAQVHPALMRELMRIFGR